MIITDDLLRDTLAAEADSMIMPAGVRERVDVRAARHHARRTVAITAGAVAVVGLALTVASLVPDAGATGVSAGPAAATASYETWAPRGGLAGDQDFAAAAEAAWDAASPGAPAHSDVRVLWADTFATGRGAVLVGTAGDGSRRLAVVAGGTPSLKVIRDIPAPQSLTHLSFNLFTDDQEHSPASYRDTLVIVTPPASGWAVAWSPGTDGAFGEDVTMTTDGVAVIDISVSGPYGNPGIRILDGTQELYAGPIGSQS